MCSAAYQWSYFLWFFRAWTLGTSLKSWWPLTMVVGPWCDLKICPKSSEIRRRETLVWWNLIHLWTFQVSQGWKVLGCVVILYSYEHQGAGEDEGSLLDPWRCCSSYSKFGWGACLLKFDNMAFDESLSSRLEVSMQLFMRKLLDRLCLSPG